MKRTAEYKVTIEKHGRIWTKITIHYPSGHDGAAQVKKEAVVNIAAGETTTLTGYIQKEYSNYGTKSTFICVSAEEANDKEAERWWSYFCEHRDAGHYYKRAVEELHALCHHEHDIEIEETRLRLEGQKWIGYFRSSAKDGKVYERAIQELHKIGCHSFDDEIEETRHKIEEQRLLRKAEKDERELSEGIRSLALPAHNGFRGKPAAGSTFIHNGAAYEVISSYYNSSDGFSVGVMSEEWYSVKARDISDTARGAELLRQAEDEKKIAERNREATAAQRRLESEIYDKGERYLGPEKDITDIPGKTILDTFNIYGGGSIIRVDCELAWLIRNNGTDGDNWSINNIRTGGAGAYAITCPLDTVQASLNAFLPYSSIAEE